jgi:SAM-dependent methyltransferase
LHRYGRLGRFPCWESDLRRSFVKHLCCLKCRGDLTLETSETTEDVAAGELRCSCGQCYAIVKGIPRFVANDQYVGNFSFEWTLHRKTQLDNASSRVSEATFAEKSGLGPADVKDKLVLDIGCGMGRFADVIVKWGGTIVGIDLSLAVESAQANLGGTGRFQAVQASVFELPFRPETFDIIYSLGVLHHTPDCKKAFMQLPPLLKPGGHLAIWVYSAHTYPKTSLEERRDSLYRRYTTKMPQKTLHNIFRVLCAVHRPGRAFWHMILPGFVFHAVPRVQTGKPYEWRVLDAFDWYSPVYQSKHSYPEVHGWYKEAGFREIGLLDFDVAVWGKK